MSVPAAGVGSGEHGVPVSSEALAQRQDMEGGLGRVWKAPQVVALVRVPPSDNGEVGKRP